jgi:hypothetical protein
MAFIVFNLQIVTAIKIDLMLSFSIGFINPNVNNSNSTINM